MMVLREGAVNIDTVKITAMYSLMTTPYIPNLYCPG